MTRLLDLASKALAVIGVLTLMYAGNGMQQAKADLPWYVPDRCYVAGQYCFGFWCEPARCCCYILGPITDNTGTHCCDVVCVPC
jgi:hypothetical protein